MIDPDTGNIALYDEPVDSGDPADPDSARNAPLNDPTGNLAHLYWHILLDNMEVFSDDVVSVSHSTIAAASGGLGGETGVQSDFDTNGSFVDHDVKTHSLGYEPLVLVAVGNNLIPPGYPAQVPGTTNGSARYVTPYVTTTKVFLHEFQSRGASTLASETIDYRILVFKQQPAADASGILIDWDEGDGVLTMGEGRFDSSRRYLQAVSGGTPFGLVTGRTIDCKNGAYRVARADETTFDPIPSTTKQGIYASGGEFASDTLVYGSAMNYDGAFTPSEIIDVQAP